MDPLVLKQGIVDVLQRFFRQDEEFVHSEDHDETRITIAEYFSVDRKNVEQYPLIAVARGTMGFQRVGLGSRASFQWAAAKGAQPKETFSNLVNGNIICHCLSYAGIEAERIAVKTANFLEMSRHELGTLLKIRIENVGIKEELHLKDWPPDLVDVSVGFEYIYATTWKITDLNTVIRGTTQTINTI